MKHARRIVALTGAGISTESGIPDFRSPGSIWQQLPPVSYQDFISKRSSINELQQRIDAGQIDPLCPDCGGFLKAATILFGQRIPDEELTRARELAQSCDLFLVIGSSLKVTPAATLPRLALKNDVPLIIINLQPTPLDNYAETVINEKAGVILPQLVTDLYISSLCFVYNHLSILDYHTYAFIHSQHSDISEGITIDDQQIGTLTNFKRTNLIL
jgi:NAD-dependent SIR2 family protein deacetylase